MSLLNEGMILYQENAGPPNTNLGKTLSFGIFLSLAFALNGCAVVTLPVKVAAKTVETVGDVAGGVIDVIDEE